LIYNSIRFKRLKSLSLENNFFEAPMVFAQGQKGVAMDNNIVKKHARDFELLSHTADIKLRVYGATKKELFRHAVIGMFQSIHPKIVGCHEQNGRVICQNLPIKREVHITSSDELALLVDFLSEALYLSDVHDEAHLDAEIHEMRDYALRATLLGAPIQGFDGVEIKAVTYHDLEIKQVDGEWQADIVFDI